MERKILKKEIILGLGGFIAGIAVLMIFVLLQNRDIKKALEAEEQRRQNIEPIVSEIDDGVVVVEEGETDSDSETAINLEYNAGGALAPIPEFHLGEMALNEVEERAATAVAEGSVPVDETIEEGKYLVAGKRSKLPWNMDKVGWEYSGFLNEWEATRSSYESTVILNAIDKLLIGGCSLDFSDVVITIIGDEMVYGGNLSATEAGDYSLTAQLRAILGCKEVRALGADGSTISRAYDREPLVDRWTSPGKDSDIIIVLAGTNDMLMGNWDNYGYLEYEQRMISGSFCGDIDEMFTGMNIVYHDQMENKYIKLMCINPPVSVAIDNHYNEDTAFNVPQEEYAKAYMYAVPPYNVDIIDMYNDNFLSTRDENIRRDFFTDDTHPNAAGYRLMAERIAGEIISRCYSE